MQIITIYFDGGCIPNPGQKYGSYEVLLQGASICKVSRRQFGHGTNNEAEWESMLDALEWVNGQLSIEGIPHKEFRVQIFTDSKVVRSRLIGRNLTPNKPVHSKAGLARLRMQTLAGRALEVLRNFSGFEVHWRGRQENVNRFGH